MDIKVFLMYLGICFGLSFFIGIERQFRRRIIGLRTTILVSIGAFLYVSLSFYLNEGDLTRVAAQVVSGIGFLGAGVILKDGLKIRGLTTAATLWCDAAIGVLCAAGAIWQAIAGTVVILFSNVVLRYVNVLINEKIDEKSLEEIYELNISSSKKNIVLIKNIVNDFVRDYTKLGIELREFSLNDNDGVINLLFKICIPKISNFNIQKVVDAIYDNCVVKKIACNKIMEVHNEEEEEAL